MKVVRFLIISTFISAVLPQAAAASSVIDTVENEVLVRWKNTDEVTVVSTEQTDLVVEALRNHPTVDTAEQNVARFVNVHPNDEFYDEQYYLHQDSDIDIDAPRAWNETTGSGDVVVAVIDTGVDIDHPDLADNIWVNTDEIPNNGVDDDGNGFIDDMNGWDFVYDDANPEPYQPADGKKVSSLILNHGTHVAGTVGAVGNNGIGVAGVAWNVQIMPIRVFDANGASSIDMLLDGMEYAMDNGADILNMSYGGDSYSTFEDELMQDAVAAGLIPVAAAGNESRNLNSDPAYPACYDNVIGVAATTATDKKASFSNWGSNCVDISAPGEDILSTVYRNSALGHDNDYGYISGTSMATPVVSGIVTLLVDHTGSQDLPRISRRLLADSQPTLGKRLKSCRVNAKGVLDGGIGITVVAFEDSNRKVEIPRKTRSADASPFFNWCGPNMNEDIAQYYTVLHSKKKNPINKGEATSNRSFAASKLDGNEESMHFRVMAKDTAGGESEIATFKYIIDTKVRKPKELLAERGDTGVQLTWQQPKGEHVAGYKVYRSDSEQGSYQKLHTGLTTEKQFIDTTVVEGETYFYKVRTKDDLGNWSKKSSHVEVTL